ncbi:MAG: hypothetical protein M1434_12685 [Chloroflexi bacterium]|nr:hypothetical protein [Chloroflexota bacterium]MCL5275580.1 hypothetical protein [Chloroflexota bacterium]
MTVQPDAAPTLAEAVDPRMTPERLQGALEAARDALLARDLGRLNSEGRLDINPVVRSCARAVVSPRASFGLTLIEPDGSSRVVFYNWLPGFAIGTWVDANQIRSFELLESDDTIADGILSKWAGAASAGHANGAATQTYKVAAAALPALPVDKPGKAEGLAAALVKDGVPKGPANDLETAFAAPIRRAVLAAASHANTAANTLVWLSNRDQSYVISQASGAADIMFTVTGSSGLSQVIASFVRDTLATAK